MPQYFIDRCVCHNKTFSEIKAVAKATGAETLEALMKEADFGHSCGTCHPYARRMLVTGEVIFHELLPK